LTYVTSNNCGRFILCIYNNIIKSSRSLLVRWFLLKRWSKN